MFNLYLAQVNDIFGKERYAQLPLAIGMLWAYANKDPLIRKNYQLSGLLYGKNPLSQTIDELVNPDILGLSCYMWNWEYNKSLAKIIKEKHPQCLIIIGGPHVPKDELDFFIKHPYIDILVHGEGELTFHEILLKHHSNTGYKNILGTSIDIDGEYVYQGDRERLNELMQLPSPYLTGVYDNLIENEDVIFSGTMEHTRGCPYSCSFCNIGQDYYNKIKRFDMERTYAEIDWMSDNKIDYISGADSNFGILKTDLDIAKYLVKKNKETGFPRKWRTDWAKNKTGKVLEIVKVLDESNMNKGITVAVQSMDSNVLDIIKRSNISNEAQTDLLNTYKDAGVETYSELILALPGETYKGFVRGYGDLIEAGQHNCINTYPCMVLPNSEYNEPEFRKKHGIKTWISPQANFFIPDETRGQVIDEYEECIMQTYTMPYDKWREALLFSIIGSFGHFLGFTHLFARFARKYTDVPYYVFYETLVQWALVNPHTILGGEISDVELCIDNAINNQGYRGRPADGIFWDFDQSIGIHVIQNKEQFYKEITQFVEKFIDDKVLVKTLVLAQKHYILDYMTTYPVNHTYDFNIFDYIMNDAPLKNSNEHIRFEGRVEKYSGLSEYAKDVFWFMRRNGGSRTSISIV